MKIVLLIFLAIILVSCNIENPKQEGIKYYPNNTYLGDANRYPIDLDSSKLNFREYVKLLNFGNSKDSIPYFLINHNKKTYFVIPQSFKRAGLIKFNNILQISNDSIFIDQGYRLNKLPKVLKRVYENNGKDLSWPDSSRKALVMLSLTNESKSKRIKESLLNIITEFNKLNREHNDTLELRIVFDNFRLIPPPPKPLKMNK